MAIYYATTKPISRTSGRSATASAAYRAGVKIEDKRSGKTHDYSKRGGVEMAFAFDKNFVDWKMNFKFIKNEWFIKLFYNY